MTMGTVCQVALQVCWSPFIQLGEEKHYGSCFFFPASTRNRRKYKALTTWLPFHTFMPRFAETFFRGLFFTRYPCYFIVFSSSVFLRASNSFSQVASTTNNRRRRSISGENLSDGICFSDDKMRSESFRDDDSNSVVRKYTRTLFGAKGKSAFEPSGPSGRRLSPVSVA